MVVGDNESAATKNSGESLEMVIAMTSSGMAWGTSRASLEATGCHQRSSACAVLPRWPPWWTNLNETHKTLPKHNF